MEEIPIGFMLILLGVFVGALIIAIVASTLKQRRVQRLTDPHRDYYKQ